MQKSTSLYWLLIWLGLGTATLAANWFGLDIYLSNHFYDTASQSFIYREHPLYSSVLHTGLKNLSVLVWLSLFLLAIWLKVKLKHQQTHHARALSQLHYTIWVLSISAVIVTAVSLLKHQSSHACPWDLALYGQTEPYFILGKFHNELSGKCFPSGHASTGWMWIPVLITPTNIPTFKALFINKKTGAQLQKLVLLAILTAITLACFTQIVRGAHFLSHVLATGWIALTLSLIACYLLNKLRKPAVAI